MGIEQSLMKQLTAWAAGKPFALVQGRSSTPNQRHLQLIHNLTYFTDADRRPGDATKAASELAQLLENQTGTNGARCCGLYALWPGPRGEDRDEARTTSHAGLWYAAVACALLATREVRDSAWRGNNPLSLNQVALLRLSNAALAWLEQDMAWCQACATPDGTIVACCARAYRGLKKGERDTKELVATSPDRNEIYRLLAGLPLLETRAGWMKDDNVQQLGYRLIKKLFATKAGDSGLLEIQNTIRTGTLTKPRFWTRFEVARFGDDSFMTWCPGGPPGTDASGFSSWLPSTGAVHSDSFDGDVYCDNRTTFYGHDEEAV